MLNLTMQRSDRESNTPNLDLKSSSTQDPKNDIKYVSSKKYIWDGKYNNTQLNIWS